MEKSRPGGAWRRSTGMTKVLQVFSSVYSVFSVVTIEYE